MSGDKYQREAVLRARRKGQSEREGMVHLLLEVLVLSPQLGLCFIDGHLHEVKLTLDEPVAEQVSELLESRQGTVCLQLALDYSGKGRVIGVR